jgi:hypothetical protein
MKKIMSINKIKIWHTVENIIGKGASELTLAISACIYCMFFKFVVIILV